MAQKIDNVAVRTTSEQVNNDARRNGDPDCSAHRYYMWADAEIIDNSVIALFAY